MKHIKLFIVTVAVSASMLLLMMGCTTHTGFISNISTDKLVTEDANPIISEALIPINEQAVPDETSPSAPTQRYLNIMGNDYSALENSKLFYNGRIYVYRSPTNVQNYEKQTELGTLLFSNTPTDNRVSTDCAILDGAEVSHLAGGLSKDALTVLKLNSANGNWWRALYVPIDAAYSSEYEYTDNADGSITIVKYRGNDEILSVPSEIDGKRVTKIGGPGEGAFSNCPTVVSVTIPEGVEVLDDNTFDTCIRLESVYLPASLWGIGHCAFQQCPSLMRLYFNGNAPYLGHFVFDDPLDEIKIYYYETSSGWDSEPWTLFNKNPL